MLAFAVLLSVVVSVRLWSALADGLDDLFAKLTVAAGVYVVAHSWVWLVVLWRRRRVIAPEPAKST